MVSNSGNSCQLWHFVSSDINIVHGPFSSKYYTRWSCPLSAIALYMCHELVICSSIDLPSTLSLYNTQPQDHVIMHTHHVVSASQGYLLQLFGRLAQRLK
jgi:hypothetical protein